MSTGFTEDDMRKALGLDVAPVPPSPSAQKIEPSPARSSELESRPIPKPKRRSPKLRVTLRVSKVFDGESELFVHDASTLSQFDAEQEAKTLAKKAKFRYFTLVSVKPAE
jgi:hypothetical protein